MKQDRRPVPAPAVDPALRPFLDALAELLVAEETRLADARRVLRKEREGAIARAKGDRAQKDR